MNLQIYRNSSLHASPDIDKSTVYQGEFMADDMIVANFISQEQLDIEIDDYALHNGSKYSIMYSPNCDRMQDGTFRYSFNMYGEIFELYDLLMLRENKPKFPYTATLLEFVSLLMDCLHAFGYTEWQIGDLTPLEETQTIEFDSDTCRTALTKIAEAFKVEYRVIGKKIYMLQQIGEEIPNVKFEWGMGKGLYNLKRLSVNELPANEWFGFGGTQNIPANYRGGLDRISFDGNPIVIDTPFRRRQRTVIFEDVYPQFTGTVTAVDGINSLTDTAIDFDLNEVMLTDGSAKIVFKTGQLAGNEFVITGFDFTTKKIQFGTLKIEDTGYILPNEARFASIGDKFTFVGIEMPQSYIDAAELEVKNLTQEHATKNSLSKSAYALDVDEKWVRDLDYEGMFQTGDKIRTIDGYFKLNAALRIQSISYPLCNPSEITATISDTVQYPALQQAAIQIEKTKQEVSKAQAKSLYARQVADEIANAAVMGQFRKTYVGERAILTGAIAVGNPEDGMAAVLTGAGTTEIVGSETIYPIVLAIGDALDNLEDAAFIIRKDGSIYANNAFLKGTVEAISGKIAGFNINNQSLIVGDIDEPDSLYAQISPEGLVFRKNGLVGGKVRVMQFGSNMPYIPEGATNGLYIENSLDNEGANTALALSASGGVLGNVALNIFSGDIIVDGLFGRTFTQDIGGGFGLRYVKGIYVGTVAI